MFETELLNQTESIENRPRKSAAAFKKLDFMSNWKHKKHLFISYDFEYYLFT